MNDHEDTEFDDTCSCGYEWKNLWDMLEHRQIKFMASLPLSANAAIDVFSILKELWNSIEEKRYEDTQAVLEGVAAAIYEAATGNFDRSYSEMLIDSFTENLDEKLKEFLDEQTDNDK
jgi:hypothetical protein